MTCLETFATLRIFSSSLDPSEIGRILGVQATKERPIDPESKYKHRRENHYWRWSTEGLVNSLDGEEHVRAITSILHGRRQQLDQLRSNGCEIDICCYWVSTGQGGPSLDGALLLALGNLDLPIWWDVYFGEKEEYEESVPTNLT